MYKYFLASLAMVGKYDSWFLQHSTGTDSVSAAAAAHSLQLRVHIKNLFHT